MRFVIVGAGAIGGFLGARLARSGSDVTLVARGAHLVAMRTNGLRVFGEDEDVTVPVQCTDDLRVVREADAVFLTMKANALAPIAEQLGALLRDDTTVVTAQNGIPWWYFERHGGPLEGTRLRSVDPDGTIARSIPIEHVVGCVVYPAAELPEPGVVRHVEGVRFPIGEVDGSRTPRCEAISAALVRGGLKCPIRPRIRDDLWLKLIGNVAFNPVSALGRATLEEIAADGSARAAVRILMDEAAAVASALGVRLEVSVEKRQAGAERIKDHKTSMLQDVEHGRPLELDPLLGAVLEIADLVDVATPALRAIYGSVRLLDPGSHRDREPVPGAVSSDRWDHPNRAAS